MTSSPEAAGGGEGAAGRPAAAKPAVYFLLHIPRTAGQTIQHHLAEHAAPGTVWLPRRRRRPLGPGGHDLDGLGDPDRVRVVAGHDVGSSLERHFAGREIRRVVLLRDPVGHQLSLYNYRMMNHLNKGLGTYGFDLHVRAQPKNWVAHRLLRDWLELPAWRLAVMSDAEKYRVLSWMLAEFWFVGSYADCDRVIAVIASDLGLPPRARPRNTAEQWRRQIYWEPLTEEALGPAKREWLLRRSRMDLALWETWRAAGFEAGSITPLSFDGGPGHRLALEEPVRRLFLAARLWRRDHAPRCRIGRFGAGLRSGFAKADLAFFSGEWETAARYYRQGLSEDPRAPAIWVQYGHALRRCGQLQQAEDAYRQSLRFEPDNADTHAQLGHVLALQHRPAAAADAYRRALGFEPGLEEAQTGLHRLLSPPASPRAARLAAALSEGREIR